MNAEDVMTSKVIAVNPETRVGKIAALMSKHRISAIPILEKERLVGIVSEADLLHRCEIGTEIAPERRRWWINVFGAGHSAEAYIKSHARQARDVMTREVATVAPDTSLAEIAAFLDKRRIKRVPVLRRGRLVGIVSRSDLIGSLAQAAAKQATRRAGPIADAAIRARLVAELRRQAWWRPAACDVSVQQGTVTYAGIVLGEVERVAARVAAEGIPGVRRVVDDRFAYSEMPAMV